VSDKARTNETHSRGTSWIELPQQENDRPMFNAQSPETPKTCINKALRGVRSVEQRKQKHLKSEAAVKTQRIAAQTLMWLHWLEPCICTSLRVWERPASHEQKRGCGGRGKGPLHPSKCHRMLDRPDRCVIFLERGQRLADTPLSQRHSCAQEIGARSGPLGTFCFGPEAPCLRAVELPLGGIR
jgi:hypothetical protein